MNSFRQLIITSTAINRFPMVFNPGKAGWKMTTDGKSIEVKDGNPIWVEADGTERVLQQDTITRLNGEAATHRKEKETLQAELTKFKGIDPEQAKKAIETVAKIDAKKLIDAGEVDKLRDQIGGEYKAQLAEREKAYNELASQFDGVRIDNVFNNSKFVSEQVAIPKDMFTAYFRSNFKIKDGKIEAYGKDGNRIMSKAKIGEFADPDEALEILVNSHGQRDVILKPNQHSGSGNNGSGGHRPGQAFIKRSEFSALPPSEQAAKAAQAAKGEIQIVD